MNAGIYKLIFSKRLNALVVVGENCSSQGKSPGTTRSLKPSNKACFQLIRLLAKLSSGALLVSTVWATPAPNALPTGGQVVQGSASISQSGAQMDINQASQRAVINWQTFDVGADAKVHIIQPNQAAVLLNRVVTNKPSEIFGKIDANGQVVLVNNNGIVFGKDGSASAASFTATTLDISDKDFMEGKTRFSSNGTQGEIVNHGTIEAKNGGYVALLGAKVSNDGKIITHNGTVALGAADSIAIPMTSSGKIKMQLSAGSINAAVENTKNGVIVTEGGDVYLQAAAANNAMASVKQAGQIDTSGEQAGKAILLADSGEIMLDGSITANSSNAANKGGDIIIGRDTDTGVLAKTTDVSGARLESKKGFVETSGDELDFGGVNVQAGRWLLDPYNISINAAEANSISTALNALGGATVDVSTTTGGYNGNVSGVGNIVVNSLISKTTGGASTLNLYADNGITLNNKIQGSSLSGVLNVNLTAKGGVAGGSTTSYGVYVTGTGGIDTNGQVVIDSTTKYTGSWDYTKSALAMNVGSVIRGSDVDIKLKVDTPSGTPYRVYGAFLQNAVTLEATAGNFAMDSKITNGANSSDTSAILLGSGFGNAVDLKASGNVSLTADWIGNAGNGGGISMVDTKISAGGNILIDSKVNAPSVSAIATSNGGSVKGFSAVSTGNGDVTFKANKGSIGLGALTAPIQGRNVTIDNTGGVISAPDANGLKTLTKGTGTSTRTDVAGVTITSNAGVAGIDASGNVNIAGVNNEGTQSGVALTANSSIKGKTVTIDGTSLNANGFITYASVEATDGDTNITGISTNASALSLQGLIKASQNVVIAGSNTNAANTAMAVYVNKAVTATAGTIDVIALTAGSSTNALQLASGASLTTNNKAINITTDTLSIETIDSPASINAGTSTVGIKTASADAKISIGDADVGSVTTSSRILGLTNPELNRITAGKTVIGDTSSTGNITVAAATTTLGQTGHIVLQTGANIDLNAALTVGDAGATKNLTLNGAGANSAISQNATITANGLELLGTNARHNLTNIGNQVTTLAANTQSINYLNNNALTLGTVNTTGINATGDVSITTQTGNLTIAENVATTASSSTALILNAGKSASVGGNVGADVGGNIIVNSGKTVSVGSYGIAQLMTGSITGDSSAAGLAYPGHFRYNSDETNTNYNTALTSGVNVIYREKPSLIVNVNNASKTYDGVAYSGGNGFTESTPSGLKNNDTLANATATALFGGSAQNAKNAANTPYTLSASESVAGKTALGYAVTYNSGSLLIDKKQVTLSASRDYNGIKTLNNVMIDTGVTVNGIKETLTYLDAVAKYKDVTNANGDNQGNANYVDSISLQNAIDRSGGLASNYRFTSANSANNSVTINAKQVALSATKTYDGNTNLTGNQLRIDTGVGTETLTYSNATINSKNVKDNSSNYVKTVILENGTGKASNYQFTAARSANNQVTLDKANAIVTANSAIVNYTGEYQTVSGFTATGLVGGETASVLTDVSAKRTEKAKGSYVTTAVGSDSNYNLKFVPGQFVINKIDPAQQVNPAQSVSPATSSSSSGSGGGKVAIAATPATVPNQIADTAKQCSIEHPEACNDCKDTLIPGIVFCLAPAQPTSIARLGL